MPSPYQSKCVLCPFSQNKLFSWSLNNLDYSILVTSLQFQNKHLNINDITSVQIGYLICNQHCEKKSIHFNPQKGGLLCDDYRSEMVTASTIYSLLYSVRDLSPKPADEPWSLKRVCNASPFSESHLALNKVPTLFHLLLKLSFRHTHLI